MLHPADRGRRRAQPCGCAGTSAGGRRQGVIQLRRSGQPGCGRRGGRSVRQPVHRRRHRRQDRRARAVGDFHPWRAQIHRHRRGGICPHGRGERRGRDPADFDGPRRHQGWLQPAADPRHRRCGERAGHRLGRRRQLGPSGRGRHQRRRQRGAGCLDLPLRRIYHWRGQGPYGRRRYPGEADMSTLHDLAATIFSRKGADPESSWTAKLFAKGPEKCAEKFGEEAVEAIIEAVKGDRAKLTAEAADVLYHLLVMLAARDVTLADVEAELARREGTSGIAEKAARG
ncbi:UNVERIFIED_CONTAM: hisE [Trichonephila clavipes]